MKSPLLVLDCHYLCHRAYHSYKNLEWKGVASGVVFGFLKTILTLKEEFQTDRIAFCFEGQNLHRKRIYSQYKVKRLREYSPEEKETRSELHRQIKKLATDYLPRIGFRNIFQYEGYESDDVMAQICFEYTAGYLCKTVKIVLVTSDSDMYQCLCPTVSIYNPVKHIVLTDRWFKRKFEISPVQWAFVKSLAGCKTDNVAGIGGVGEITALKMIKSGIKLSRSQLEISARNSRLVELPFEGCPTPRIVRDEISEKGWRSVCKELGMGSILHQMPMFRRNEGIPRKNSLL